MMGSSMGATAVPYLSVRVASAFSKLAFSRSIWLMTNMRAVLLFSQAAYAFSAPTLRPDTALTVIIAPSATSSGPTISPAKSKKPGTSIRLILVSLNSRGATAALMEI